jgi:hypothetical protein
MADSDLIAVLRQQMVMQQQQMEMQRQQMEMQRQQIEEQRRQDMEQHQEQMHAMMKALTERSLATPVVNTTAVPAFSPFDSSAELWADYWDRFCTFATANSVAEDKLAQVFLTNQTASIYKMINNLAQQATPVKQIKELTMKEIEEFMKKEFDPKRFVIRERFRFWSEMKRKPGETIQELASRIRQDAATCNFRNITDAQDEALRTRFICSVNNEAVLKAIFRKEDQDVTFNAAVQIAIEVEEAAKVAKETVYGGRNKPVLSVGHKSKPKFLQHNKKASSNASAATKGSSQGSDASCYRCGKNDHRANTCKYKNSKCNFCKNVGHLEVVCMKKRRTLKSGVKTIYKQHWDWVHAVQGDEDTLPKLEVPLIIQGKHHLVEVDTGCSGNFITEKFWKTLGSPPLEIPKWRYESASKHDMPVMGTFVASTKLPDMEEEHNIRFIVSKVPDLNLLGRTDANRMKISVDKLMHSSYAQTSGPDPRLQSVKSVGFDKEKPDEKLQFQCKKLCEEFPDLWKPELGCLKDVEIEVQFKPNANPVFKKARPVPLALQEDLDQAYDEGIAKGVWKPTPFCEYGTPVVPIRKTALPGQTKPKLRVCGDYSVTINPQLEDHRQPIPLPEDLMRKLGGGYGFTKIDLADAYNQIKLAPESQRRLALNTHRGVLLQMRLPFGIKSAPGYFQDIMTQLTADLPGVAVYLDDILISGTDAENHLRNLRQLLQRLSDRGLRCKLEKCQFAQPSVEYLGHKLSRNGIAKGSKIDAVKAMPPPRNVSSLRAFLGSVQFYAKFLPNLATIAEPLHRLTKKNTSWKWGDEEQQAFQKMKELLSTEEVLVHYDPTLPLGLSCDASSVGVGAVLFHRFPDGSERPIANASKTLTKSQRNYSQIQKEALAIVYGLRKFYQFLYGRQFILVTDHKPLLALFAPNKETPILAANRLARWALLLSQFDYTIEYRNTSAHANADVLSRLPSGEDSNFDGKETGEDSDMICTIRVLSLQVKPNDPSSLASETAKDPVLSTVMRYTREGWPQYTKEVYSEVGKFKTLMNSLTISNGCLLHGTRVVIPQSMRPKVLQILHLGHFGMLRMKQLARSAVFWPNIDSDIEATCRHCTSCAEHQNQPPKPAVHPWMLPEKPWSRLHLDHAINFLGSNWLVLTDAYSKYPCIHPTQSVSSKATMDLLEQDFAHFGYPHALVTDNASCFLSEEFQSWCKERGITHLTGAPYHPATNGSAERLVQTFKKALVKSDKPPKQALQEFLIQYRRTPTSNGFSPSEMLNGRQIRTKIDTLLPSPAHIAQGKQTKEANKSQSQVAWVAQNYQIGDPVYARYYGPRRDKEPRWVPAVIVKKHGSRSLNVKVVPTGPIWRRHIEQLRPRYRSPEDLEPGEESSITPPKKTEVATTHSEEHASKVPGNVHLRREVKLPLPEYGPDRPRRSKRTPKAPDRLCLPVRTKRLKSRASGSAGRCHSDP